MGQLANGQPSRLALARQRLHTTQLVVCAASVSAFMALLLAVRAAHPATTTSTSGTASAAAGQAQQGGSSFGFGSGTFGSSNGGSAQVQTGGS